MVASTTAALICAAALGLWFANTRAISIAAAALLTWAHPWLILPILIGSVAAFYILRISK